MSPGCKGDAGATAVEFSLIATLLFLLLVGIIQFGLAYNRQQGLHHAAREGARLASLGTTVTEGDVTSRIGEAAPAFVAEADLDITVAPSESVAGAENGWCQEHQLPHPRHVKVTVGIDPGATGKYEVSLPVIGRFLPKLTGEAVFLCEAVRP